jgi:ribosomal protein S18 acetylase RimI-like enzyme
METRVATEADLDGLTATLAAAFEADPLWGQWAFSDLEELTVWWRFHVVTALRYSCVWVRGDYAAVSVWIPPGGTEYTEEDEERIGPLVARLAGPRAGDIMDLLDRFDASHPDGPPHYHLTLLGTHPDFRGRGLGMGLLAENLASLGDAEGAPSFLESTNPANIPRYERLGFRPVGEFSTPDGERTVTTMWRDVQAPAEPS